MALAKSSKKTTTAKASSGVTKKKTLKEERDLKAKEKVRELLEDVSVFKEEKKESILELDTQDEPQKGGEWLEEQVSTLTERNEFLENEAQTAKDNYKRLYEDYQKIKSGGNVDDSVLKVKVLELFEELQTNYIRMGINTRTNQPNFIIHFPAFLNRLIVFFPFLNEHKKFK